jgi:hypothetical protein
MALTEKTIVDKIELLENNSIQVRTANVIDKDSLEISRTFHRHVLNPGDDISEQDPKVQAVANAIWTEEIIATYLQIQNENQIKNENNTYGGTD